MEQGLKSIRKEQNIGISYERNKSKNPELGFLGMSMSAHM